MKQLFPHQSAAIDLLRESHRRGKRRPMLQLSVAAGKTVIAAGIIRSAIGRGKRVLFIVDAISLIDQTVSAFFSEGIHSIGVIQADHPMTDYSRQVQVASVQTLKRRRAPHFDIAIVDEAHCQYEAIRDLMTDNPDTPFIGLSATPWSKGLGLWFDDLIKPISMQGLIDIGRVLPLTAYAPSRPDLSDVKVRAGEYRDDQLSKVMQGEKLIADVVQTWKELGENRPTFAFCVDRAHAQTMQERFQSAGVGCGYIDGMTPAVDRMAIKRQLDAGEIRVVCSVGALIKGVDWIVSCVISAAPTKSPMKWVQSIGRGLRVNPPWTDCILLDHSDNSLRLGLPVDIDRETMCVAQKGERSDTGEATAKSKPAVCPRCAALRRPNVKVCFKCGFEAKIASDISEGAGSLALIDGGREGPKKKGPTPADKLHFYQELLGWAASTGKPEKQAAGKFKAKFGEWPARKHGIEPIKPSPETLSWIKAQNIRFAKAMDRRRAA